MKVVVAIDSFKGSLSSLEAGFSIKKAILKVKPDAQVIVKPLADGGEGTTDSLTLGLGGEKIPVTITGPLGEPVTTYYGYIKETRTAIMEMASAAGITLIKHSEKNPFKASTYGVGEMMLHAIQHGCQNFVIGIGGSATNDGGIGMLQALGWKFLDSNGTPVGEGAQALSLIHTIDASAVPKEVLACNYKIACDVTNPLCGLNGATYIYGPQKGITEDNLEQIDLAMSNYAFITHQCMHTSYENTAGAGAAGGMGFAFLSYLNAQLIPGVELILNAVSLESDIKDADIVITGEGKLDSQTAMGKAPIGVARLAKKHNTKVIAFAGCVTPDAAACHDSGIDAFFPIIREITTLEEAMQPDIAALNLELTAEQVFRLL